MQESKVAGKVESNATPVEMFTRRIEIFSDRLREQCSTMSAILDRIVGEEAATNALSQDRSECGPGEYNVLNYAIDNLCERVDSMQQEIERMHERL